ncbi:MAG TPA: metallophosphoesterase [Thermoanaerobaculia bacterium]|jgi:predicted MPP superfamily phosphohydrolase
MLVRLLIFLAVALLIFVPLNWISYRQLTRTHPKRKRWIVGALIAGNLMWPFIPFIRTFTPFSRAIRSTLGPIWFGWASFTLLYTLFVLLVLLAWIPFRKRPLHEFARWPSRVFLTIVTAGFLLGFYQALVPLRIERVAVSIANLPPSLEGKKLALMGDLHVGLFTRESRLQKIFTTAGQLAPDAVLIAGDLLDDDPHFVPKLLGGARHLPPQIPLLAVLGNHEIYGDPLDVQKSLAGSRIKLLVNEGHPIGDLWIAGLSDPAAVQRNVAGLAPDLGKALQGKPATSVPVVLSHQPKAIDDAKKRAMPLVLSAHTHGGQLGFRPLRWSLAGVFLPYHLGLYDLGATQLYINTGTGYWLFPFRLGMTPEITLIELKRR